MCYELNDFLNADEPVAMETMLGQLVSGVMQNRVQEAAEGHGLSHEAV